MKENAQKLSENILDPKWHKMTPNYPRFLKPSGWNKTFLSTFGEKPSYQKYTWPRIYLADYIHSTQNDP